MTASDRLLGRALNFATLLAIALIGLAGWYSYVMSSPNWCRQLQVAGTVADKLDNDDVAGTATSTASVTEFCAGILSKQLDHMGWANLAIIGALALSILGIYFVRMAGAKANAQVSADGSISAEIGGE